MTHTPADPRPPRPRRRNPQGTRDRLTRAALELFTSQGYHGTTTPQIARRAGVAEGTIYRHFRSKEHLVNELYRSGLAVLLGVLRAPRPGKSAAAVLEAVAAEWCAAASREPALVRMVLGTRFAGVLDERSRQTQTELKDSLSAIVASGKAQGEIRTGGAETLAEIWYRLVSLVVDRVAAGIWRPHDPASRLVLEAARDAIRPRPAGQAPVGT